MAESEPAAEGGKADTVLRRGRAMRLLTHGEQALSLAQALSKCAYGGSPGDPAIRTLLISRNRSSNSLASMF